MREVAAGDPAEDSTAAICRRRPPRRQLCPSLSRSSSSSTQPPRRPPAEAATSTGTRSPRPERLRRPGAEQHRPRTGPFLLPRVLRGITPHPRPAVQVPAKPRGRGPTWLGTTPPPRQPDGRGVRAAARKGASWVPLVINRFKSSSNRRQQGTAGSFRLQATLRRPARRGGTTRISTTNETLVR